MENISHTIRGRTKSPRTLESNSKDPLSAAKPYIQIYKSDVQHIVSKSKCVAARYALIKNIWIPMFQHSERPQESSRQVYVRNAYIV